VNEPNKTFAPELSPAGSRKWIGRLVIAVVLGVAIWSFVVSLTTNVVMPALAQVMPADPQSPLYLGNGELNIAALFTSFLELCFAAIAALLVNSWARRMPRPARRKAVRPAPPMPTTAAAKPATEPVSQVSPPAPAPAAAQPSAVAAQSGLQPQAAQPPAPPAKPAETKSPKPKKVYYNLVGEEIEADDE
jgi:large-conductance mechanosensitive channel